MDEKRRDAGTLTAGGAGADSPASEPASSRRRAGAFKRKANAATAVSGSSITSSSSSAPPSKRMATREKSSSIFASPPSQPQLLFHNGPLTRAARQAPNNNNNNSSSSSSSLFGSAVKQELEKASMGEGQDGGKVREKAKEEEEMMKMSKAVEEWEALEAKIEAEFEAVRSRERNAHVVPNHCGWFSWTQVHPLEERSLPSFFNGKSQGRSPDVYMEIRNWIMKKFHANPNTQIELEDLSELDVADSDAKQEIVEFLDYWGLINFHPFLPTDSDAHADAGDETEEKDSLIEKLYHFQASQPFSVPILKPHLTTQAVPSGLLPESMVVEDLLKQEGPSVEYHCNSCSADCSRKRYHCQTQADYDLCTECFNSGKFGSDMSSSDFILMEPAESTGVGSGKWTDQETLLLLEALELFKENWSEIAEHVATKTKAQCMLHFLQMPIEDAFLDHDDDKDASSKETAANSAGNNDDRSVPKDVPEATESKDGATDSEPLTSRVETSKPEDASEVKVSQETSRSEDKREVKDDQKTSKSSSTNEGKCGDETDENIALKALREAFEDVGYPLTPESSLSFADVGNPVMVLAAFLAKLVGSNVATASARASLKSIVNNSPGLWFSTRHCFLLEDPPDDKKESAVSKSAVANANNKNAPEDVKPEGRQEENNDNNSKEVGDSVREERRPVSPTDKSTAKTEASRESKTRTEVQTGVSEKPKDPTLPNKSANNELVNDETRQTGRSESAGDASQPRHLELVDSLPSEKKKTCQPVETVGEDSQAEDAPGDAANVPDTSATLHPANGAVSGEDQSKDGKKEKHDREVTKDGDSIEKLRSAAVSALSGAAVKAKLLAKQEEDQIRQLSVSLIEKQLRKLETKLSSFNEMEGVMMRVRDQLERSRQRLYQERAQIIAARLSMPASSSKATLPTNRIATHFANAVPRPPMGMAYPRPPMSRPMGMGAVVPAGSNPLVSAKMAGSSAQPSGSDKVSSV